jgi:hypothetical protein
VLPRLADDRFAVLGRRSRVLGEPRGCSALAATDSEAVPRLGPARVHPVHYAAPRRSSSVVEQGTHKPLVTGSNPVSATNDTHRGPGLVPGSRGPGPVVGVERRIAGRDTRPGARTSGPGGESQIVRAAVRLRSRSPGPQRVIAPRRGPPPPGVYCGGRPATRRSPYPEAPRLIWTEAFFATGSSWSSWWRPRPCCSTC